MAELVTIKVSPDARRLLRLMAAGASMKQYDIIERLVRAEYARLKTLGILP